MILVKATYSWQLVLSTDRVPTAPSTAADGGGASRAARQSGNGSRTLRDQEICESYLMARCRDSVFGSLARWSDCDARQSRKVSNLFIGVHAMCAVAATLAGASLSSHARTQRWPRCLNYRGVSAPLGSNRANVHNVPFVYCSRATRARCCRASAPTQL